MDLTVAEFEEKFGSLTTEIQHDNEKIPKLITTMNTAVISQYMPQEKNVGKNNQT